MECNVGHGTNGRRESSARASGLSFPPPQRAYIREDLVVYLEARDANLELPSEASQLGAPFEDLLRRPRNDAPRLIRTSNHRMPAPGTSQIGPGCGSDVRGPRKG